MGCRGVQPRKRYANPFTSRRESSACWNILSEVSARVLPFPGRTRDSGDFPVFTQFKLRERDGYLSRLNPHAPLATRRELRVSPLVGEYLFDEVLVSQAGDRLQGDVSLKSNTIMLDTLAKRSQAPKARTFPPPKRPAPASTPLVSVKKPKQNPQPAGRGRGKQGKGHYFSGQSAHKGKGRGAKGSGRP